MTHFNTSFAKRVGDGDVDFVNDSFGALLFMTDSTAESEKDAATIGDLTTLDEFDGSGYSSGGIALGGLTWTQDDPNDQAVWDCNDLAFGTLGNGTRQIKGALIYQNAPVVGANFVAANSEFLSHADDGGLELGNADFTICGWFKLGVGGATRNVLSKMLTTGNNRSIDIFVHSGGTFRAVLNSDGAAAATAIATVTTIVPGKAYFFMVRYNAGTDLFECSVNASLSGDEYASATHAGGVFNGTAPFVIGAGFSGASQFWEGIISRIGIWNVLLTDTELAYLASPRSYADLGIVGTLGANLLTGLAAYWNLDEDSDGSGAVQRDDNGPNALHLTDNNTASSDSFVDASSIVGVQSLGAFNPDSTSITLIVPTAGILHQRALTN